MCFQGNQCAFRHQPAARTTEVTCPDWIKGSCLKSNCGLRHISIDRTARPEKNKKAVPCYYDSQPSGCLNPKCSYMHKNSTVPGNLQSQITASEVPSSDSPVQSVQQNEKAIFQIKPDIVTKIPPATPLPVLPEGAIIRPTLVNGVLRLPSRGILGAPPPGIQVIA